LLLLLLLLLLVWYNSWLFALLLIPLDFSAKTKSFRIAVL